MEGPLDKTPPPGQIWLDNSILVSVILLQVYASISVHPLLIDIISKDLIKSLSSNCLVILAWNHSLLKVYLHILTLFLSVDFWYTCCQFLSQCRHQQVSTCRNLFFVMY